MSSHAQRERVPSGLTQRAIQATLHCLAGCAVGEILGMVIATALGWGAASSIAISVILAFVFGYALTLRSLLRSGVEPRRAMSLSFASDTISIATMEIVDNVFIVLVPGALAAGLTDSLFWWSLLISLAVAFAAAVPVNRWLIARGRGHAVIHDLHGN
jgi:Domain of unknown function (DUF4396)